MIIAVDFDGTLCKDKFPEIGEPNVYLINGLKHAQKNGNKLILWTCREDHYLEEAVEWCKSQGLEFDTVNRNITPVAPQWEHYVFMQRKVYADLYIDDRSELPKWREEE